MESKENGSVLDLKMGTNSFTKYSSEERRERIKRKDEKSTSSVLGFRVTGYIIKDQEGQVLEKVLKPHGTATVDKIPEIIANVLKSNGLASVNLEALKFLLEKAREMLNFFEKRNSREFRGSSLLIVVDNIARKYDMRIIDLASVEDYDSLDKRDEGYITGLKNLIKMLELIQEGL